MNSCKEILIVEDNIDIRECLMEALSGEGFRVQCAANGKAALALLENQCEPTLVLLDLMMPVMNGWEFLDAQKKDSRLAGHHIVTISAVNPSQSIEDTTPLKTDGSLSKPLSLDAIWAEVHKHCVAPRAPSAS